MEFAKCSFAMYKQGAAVAATLLLSTLHTPSLLQQPAMPGSVRALDHSLPLVPCMSQAGPKDYMEWLSDQAAIPLKKLLLDNVERVTDIDAIGGVTLLLCDPDKSK